MIKFGYIVDIDTYMICQKKLFKRGYRWLGCIYNEFFDVYKVFSNSNNTYLSIK